MKKPTYRITLKTTSFDGVEDYDSYTAILPAKYDTLEKAKHFILESWKSYGYDWELVSIAQS